MYLERCFQSFNTASGKYYCNYTIHPGDKVAVPIYSFNTASGKYYCNGTGISFDDAGIANCFNTASGKYYCNQYFYCSLQEVLSCFNTASGKYYCNSEFLLASIMMPFNVSIPQAVSTIAISYALEIPEGVELQFQYRKR